jgi:hypothetical protein
MFRSRLDDDSSSTARTSAHYFRIRFLGPAICFSTLASAVALLLIFLDNPNGAPDTIGVLIVRLLPIPIAAFFVGVLVRFCPIRVTSRGIKYPAWPLVREVPWNEMHSVLAFASWQSIARVQPPAYGYHSSSRIAIFFVRS